MWSIFAIFYSCRNSFLLEKELPVINFLLLATSFLKSANDLADFQILASASQRFFFICCKILIIFSSFQFGLKGRSHEKICEIINLNYRLGLGPNQGSLTVFKI
jgi:hypothetical protein